MEYELMALMGKCMFWIGAMFFVGALAKRLKLREEYQKKLEKRVQDLEKK